MMYDVCPLLSPLNICHCYLPSPPHQDSTGQGNQLGFLCHPIAHSSHGHQHHANTANTLTTTQGILSRNISISNILKHPCYPHQWKLTVDIVMRVTILINQCSDTWGRPGGHPDNAPPGYNYHHYSNNSQPSLLSLTLTSLCELINIRSE